MAGTKYSRMGLVGERAVSLGEWLDSRCPKTEYPWGEADAVFLVRKPASTGHVWQLVESLKGRHRKRVVREFRSADKAAQARHAYIEKLVGVGEWRAS